MKKNDVESGIKTKLPTWKTWKPKLTKETDKEKTKRKDKDSRKEFEYTGSVKIGTAIYYGKSTNMPIRVIKEKYKELFQAFNKKNKPINIGTSKTKPPQGSVGEWLKVNVSPTAIASYVGSILIHEGYAIKGKDPATIEFL